MDRAYETLLCLLKKRLDADGLSLNQSFILLSLFFEARGAITPKDLTNTLRMTAPNVSHQVTSLEKRKLLGRRLNPADSRSYVLELTPEGRKLSQKLVRIHHSTQDGFEKAVGAEAVRRMISTLKIIEGMSSNG